MDRSIPSESLANSGNRIAQRVITSNQVGSLCVSFLLAVPVWLAFVLLKHLGWVEPDEFENILAVGLFIGLYPLLEELVFRGLLMDLLSKYRWAAFRRLGVTTNNLFVSIIFSLLHLISQDLENCLLVFVPSLWLGIVKESTGSTWTCAVVHMLWNFGLFCVLYV